MVTCQGISGPHHDTDPLMFITITTSTSRAIVSLHVHLSTVPPLRFGSFATLTQSSRCQKLSTKPPPKEPEPNVILPENNSQQQPGEPSNYTPTNYALRYAAPPKQTDQGVGVHVRRGRGKPCNIRQEGCDLSSSHAEPKSNLAFRYQLSRYNVGKLDDDNNNRNKDTGLLA